MTQRVSDRPGLDGPGGPDEPGGGTGTMLEVHEETTPRTAHGDGDHERFAHYVKKEKILESALSGDPVIALCGKVWVPGRDPQRFPVCPTCQEIFGQIPPGSGDDDESSGSGDR
jgi:hypothetical protein